MGFGLVDFIAMTFEVMSQLCIWHYNRRETSSPAVILKTRRSLRAVHFHPHGAPFLLTAEVIPLHPFSSLYTQSIELDCLLVLLSVTLLD